MRFRDSNAHANQVIVMNKPPKVAYNLEVIKVTYEMSSLCHWQITVLSTQYILYTILERLETLVRFY